jgi:DNA invertase Pin-like site-specific DNA recombinase
VDENIDFLNSGEGRALFEEQIYSLVIQILAHVYTDVRRSRKEKQRRGIALAREKGIELGRKKEFNATDYVEIFKQVEKGEKSIEQVTAEIGFSRTTYFKMKKELKKMGII